MTPAALTLLKHTDILQHVFLAGKKTEPPLFMCKRGLIHLLFLSCVFYRMVRMEEGEQRDRGRGTPGTPVEGRQILVELGE